MYRLAVAFVAAVLGGTTAGCGGHGGGPPQHLVAAGDRSTAVELHAELAALEQVRATRVTAPPPAPPPAPGPPTPRAASAPRSSRAAGGPRPVAPAPPAADVWTALARCESGMRNDTGGPYYGYFQFSASTWRSLGYSGLPTDHDYATQLAAAQRLVARSGWGQFPACARKLGLR